MSDLVGYLAPEGFLPQLQRELDGSGECFGRLVLAPPPEHPVAWVANLWRDPVRLPIASIGDAANQLRAIQRNWALYPFAHHRRAALITERLPSLSAKPLAFGEPAPKSPLGSWTLIDPNTILAAPNCSSPFPNGEIKLIEDRETSPSRAYLKLWELFTLIDKRPRPGDLCVDLGACPGGWSWVLQTLGARVISVDKAPLDPRIAALPGIEVRQDSAFAIDPTALGAVDWLLSDVVCYPARLLKLVERWIAAGTAKRFVCTLKFQGETDYETARAFAAIPGSRLLHLYNNKHELTWIKL